MLKKTGLILGCLVLSVVAFGAGSHMLGGDLPFPLGSVPTPAGSEIWGADGLDYRIVCKRVATNADGDDVYLVRAVSLRGFILDQNLHVSSSHQLKAKLEISHSDSIGFLREQVSGSLRGIVADQRGFATELSLMGKPDEASEQGR